MLDLHLDFKRETQLLPVLVGDPSEEQARQLGCLKAFFAAAPWGALLPTVDFKGLGAHPSFVHGILGDTTWVDCWKDRQAGTTVDHSGGDAGWWVAAAVTSDPGRCRPPQHTAGRS